MGRSSSLEQCVQAVFDDYGIGYTDFIRTTQPRHHAAVNAIWVRFTPPVVGAWLKLVGTGVGAVTLAPCCYGTPRSRLVLLPPQNALQANGHIYLGEYEGWYSVADESFYADNQVRCHRQRLHFVPGSLENTRP